MRQLIIVMKKIFQVIGSAIYSIIAALLLLLFFCWLTPIVMSMSWRWFLVYLLIAGCLLGLTKDLSILLAVPSYFLTNGCLTAKITQAIIFAFHGYCSIRLPWVFEFHYGFLQWLLAISLSITILITFGSMIVFPFLEKRNEAKLETKESEESALGDI